MTRLSVDEVLDEFEAAGYTVAADNGHYVAPCPTCAGQVTITSEDGRAALECVNGCAPLEIGQALHFRTSGPTYGSLPRRRPSWPAPLAEAAFHGLLGRVVRAIEPHTEADPAALLVQLLVAFGSAVGRGPGYQVDGAFHGTNENALVVGETAIARKGTSWGASRSSGGWSTGHGSTGASSTVASPAAKGSSTACGTRPRSMNR
jgi:hypothetical protein